MTSLTILPNTDKKTLKLTGKVAAGEHVAVSVSGGADWIGVGKALRLRVLFGMKQVAMFPLVTEEDAAADTSGETVADAWAAGGEGDADATCTLNLFTIPAEKYLKFGGNCLWVLDDIENNTLYGTGEMEVLPWPKRRGSDVPYALDEYPDIVAELGERIDAAEESISGAVDEANGIVAYVTAAKSDAESSAQTARVARNQAQTAQGKAEDAQAAAEAAQAAVEAALPLDATLAIQGKAADAKAVGDAIALKADKSTTYTKFETYTKTETINAISTAIATVVDSAPEAFDTLKEIADWIEDDQSGAAAMAAAIKGKVDKVSGKGLSANDYTDAEKSKLAGIAAGAQVNPTPIAPANATESGMFADAYWTKQDLSGKADKVANATAGNLAAFDPSGNLADSGKAIDDFALAESLAPAFVPYNAYEVGDLCTSFDNDDNHRGTWLYKCILATDGSQPTTPEIDPTHWALATVEDVLAALRTALASKADASSLAPVATSGNYDDLIDKPTIPTIPTPVAPASATASGQFADALATKSELAAKVALEEFSSGSWAQGSSYSSGDIVFYDGFLYLCSSDVSSSSTPPSEDPTHWDQVTVNYLMFLKADAATTLAGYGITDAHITNGVITLGAATITPLTSHQDISGKANNAAIATVFSASATYAVGDVVMYEGTRYKCATAVTVAGAWTGSTNWTAESVQDVIGDVESALHTINYGAQS